jgi:hypothetical protein
VNEDRSNTTVWRHFYQTESKQASAWRYVLMGLQATYLAAFLTFPRLSGQTWSAVCVCSLLVGLVLGIVGIVMARKPGLVIWIGSTGLWYPGSFGKKFLPAEAMQRVLWGGDNLTIKQHDGSNATIPTLLLSSADQVELRKCVERLIAGHRRREALPAAG